VRDRKPFVRIDTERPSRDISAVCAHLPATLTSGIGCDPTDSCTLTRICGLDTTSYEYPLSPASQYAPYWSAWPQPAASKSQTMLRNGIDSRACAPLDPAEGRSHSHRPRKAPARARWEQFYMGSNPECFFELGTAHLAPRSQRVKHVGFRRRSAAPRLRNVKTHDYHPLPTATAPSPGQPRFKYYRRR